MRAVRRYGLAPVFGPRLFLAGGMNRSGSTLLYNAARLMLLDQVGAENLGYGWISDWPNLERRRYLLVKLHELDLDLAAAAHVVFYSFRDVRDVLASAQRVWGQKPTAEAATHQIAQHRHWSSVADLVVRYETLLDDRAVMLERLARVLGAANIDVEALGAALDRLDGAPAEGPAGAYDPVSLLHPGHRTDGRHGSWIGALDPVLVRRIEREHRDWFIENGYALTENG